MGDTSQLAPLENLYDGTRGVALPLSSETSALYGPLRFPPCPERPYVISNFVTSLDGVVSTGAPGRGGDVGGGQYEDRFVMGLLRAAADAVVLGAGTLRAFPRHLWTPEAISPPRAADYRQLRLASGRTTPPLRVIVTGSGDLDPTLPVFGDPAAAVVVTTNAGARKLAGHADSWRLLPAGDPPLSAPAILRALAMPAGSRILLECGPTLMGRFLQDHCVDEVFLTVSPQIFGGRRAPSEGFAAHALLKAPLGADLLSAKRCRSLLFLRYRLHAPGGA